MKRSGFFNTVCIITMCITLCISFVGCNDHKYAAVEEKPYFCYYPLDWGMTYDEVCDALGLKSEAFRSAPGKTLSGLPSTAYIGTADIFEYSSDVTFWFTAYNEGEPEGLSSITIANSFLPGKKAETALQRLIKAYNLQIDTQVTKKEFAQTEDISITKVFSATPVSTVENDFAVSWNSLLLEKSEREIDLEEEYLSTAVLKYMEGGKKYRLDINGEAAAYYNYLNSK